MLRVRVSSGPNGTRGSRSSDGLLKRFYGAGQGIKGYVTVGHGEAGLGGDFGDEALGVDDVAVEAELLGLDAECQSYHLGEVDDG